MTVQHWCKRHGEVTDPTNLGICPKCEGALAMKMATERQKRGDMMSHQAYQELRKVCLWGTVALVGVSMGFGILIGHFWL